MSTVYLFQIDGAQNNDVFFAALRSSSTFFYKGSAFRVGDAPWIPDGVRIEVQDSRCLLTLIELEDTKANALISSRKYLPENSHLIALALCEYLDRIIAQCQSTGDPRECGFAELKTVLGSGVVVVVSTGCALRSSAELIEELPLSDQPHGVSLRGDGFQRNAVEADEPRSFEGVIRMNAEKAKALGRCVLVLDAVIRHHDHSNATFHTWRNRSPLKHILRETDRYPALRDLIVGAVKTGMRLDSEVLLSELVVLWSSTADDLQTEEIRHMINTYYPMASRIKGKERMGRIFDDARTIRRSSTTSGQVTAFAATPQQS